MTRPTYVWRIPNGQIVARLKPIYAMLPLSGDTAGYALAGACCSGYWVGVAHDMVCNQADARVRAHYPLAQFEVERKSSPACFTEPGSEHDTRLYACVSGARKLHILRDDGSGYYDVGALCGVQRNLGEARSFPEHGVRRGLYTVCPACLKAEGDA